MTQHEPAPVWVLLLLAVSAFATTGAVVVTGVILAFAGWMGSEPASPDEWALFVLAVAAMFGVAGAYRWFGRVTIPSVLMALAAVCAMLPLAGLVGAIPLAGAALIASAVPPLRRTRHKRLAFTGVAVAVTVVGAIIASPFIVTAQLNDEIARSDGARLLGEEPADPPFTAVYSGDDPHQLEFSTRLTAQSFTPAVVGHPASVTFTLVPATAPLPDSITFDGATGTFTGPASWRWSAAGSPELSVFPFATQVETRDAMGTVRATTSVTLILVD